MSIPNHGANPYRIYDHYGIDMPEDIIDFSTNTNVLKQDIQLDLEEQLIAKYPDPTCQKLVQKLSEQLRVSENELLMSNGANEAIYMLASHFAGRQVAILVPTYPEYEKAFRAYHCQIHYVEQASELCRYPIGVICNPNNPTGQAIDLRELVQQAEVTGTTCIVDESYVDFMTEAYQPVEHNHQVYILRSFTKIYSMAGLRGGYVISASENIETLRQKQPTWSVNSVLQAYALQLLEDNQFIRRTQMFYKREKQSFVKALRELGFQVLDSHVNFFLMAVDNDDEMIKNLLKKGLVVRHTKNHVGLDGRYLRVAVRTEAENQRFIEALKEIRYD